MSQTEDQKHEPAQRAPISPDFKKKRGQREVRMASKEDVSKAADWAAKTYPTVFKRLAE